MTFVTRFELPGINGFNFVLHNSLGGGGIASLRVDPQVSNTLFDIGIVATPILTPLKLASNYMLLLIEAFMPSGDYVCKYDFICLYVIN